MLNHVETLNGKNGLTEVSKNLQLIQYKFVNNFVGLRIIMQDVQAGMPKTFYSITYHAQTCYVIVLIVQQNFLSVSN